MNWTANFIQIILKAKVSALINNRKVSFVEDLVEHDIIIWGKVIKKKTKCEISLSTLKRILRGEYDFDRKDTRVKKNLNAIAKTFGYKQWENFVVENTPNFKTLLYADTIDIEKHKNVIKTIISAKKAEYNSYKLSPQVDISELENYYVDEDDELDIIYWSLMKREKAHTYLHKPTSFYTMKPVALSFLYSNIALVETVEEWYLVWKHTKSHKTIEVSDQKLSKTYCLYKQNDKWHIFSEGHHILGEDAVSHYKIEVN